MLNKKILILMLGIFILQFIPAQTFNATINNGQFLITDDNFTEFRQALLSNYTYCHDNKANATYHNYTRSLDMQCHIYFNNTDKVVWEDVNLYFNLISPLMNTSWSAIVQENNSQIEFQNVFVTGTGNLQTTVSGVGGTTYIGMREDLHIGTCHRSAANGAGLSTNYDTTTNFELYNSAFAHFSYLQNTSKATSATFGNNGLSFLCNGVMNNTFWINSQPSGLPYNYGGGFGGVTSTNSYLEKVSSMISAISTPLVYSGSFTLNEGEDITYDHKKTTYCFVPTSGVANFTLTNAILKCGGNFAFAFAGTAYADLYDCTADTFASSGFLANWDIKNYFSFKQSFNDSSGKPVYVTYNFTDAQGIKYDGKGTSIDENILVYNYKTSGNVEHKPLNINITNASYFPVQNTKLYMTTNNKGIFEMIKIPYSIELNPSSSTALILQ